MIPVDPEFTCNHDKQNNLSFGAQNFLEPARQWCGAHVRKGGVKAKEKLFSSSCQDDTDFLFGAFSFLFDVDGCGCKNFLLRAREKLSTGL